jgi:hypothetical protein
MRAAERLRFLAREPWIVLAPLVVAQWIAVAVFTTFVNHNGWLFYQGGDQSWFYTAASSLARGRIPEAIVGWAWPLALVPLAELRGPNFLSAVPAIVGAQFLLLLPLGVLCAYGIAARIGGRLLGYWAAAWWVAVPYAVVPLFVHRYHDTYVEQTLPQGFGLTGMADFPSMIAVFASAYFAVRAVDSDDDVDAIAAGLLAGLAFGIKPANALFAAAPLAALAVARRWRVGAVFAGALLPGLLVLAVWKYRGGQASSIEAEAVRLAAGPTLAAEPAPLADRFGEFLPLDREHLNDHFTLFREFFWSARLLEFLPLAGAVAVARRSVPIAVLLATWLGAYFVVKGSAPAATVESGSFWRLLMPAWPAYFVLAAALPLLVPRFGARLAAAVPPPAASTQRRRLALVVVAALAFAAPAAAFAVLPDDDTRTNMRIEARSLLLPVDDRIRLTASSLPDGGIDLRWSHPSHGGARSFYVVLRSAAFYPDPVVGIPLRLGVRCVSRDGPDTCVFVMPEHDRTRRRSFVDRPGPGRWAYRVAISANWIDDQDEGDMLVISPPLEVVVVR